MNNYLKQIVSGQYLMPSEAEEIMDKICSSAEDTMSIAMILVALHTRRESKEEIVGFLRSLKKKMISVPIDERAKVIDVCGTGGDHSNTFNISTASALVLAGGGVKVAKHGGRSVSSKSGSVEVLEALGVSVAETVDQAVVGLEEAGCTFLSAPAFNPVFKEISKLRKRIGVRTSFNLLGPLLNPAGVKRQVIGVYSKDLLLPIAEVLREMGSEEVIVVHSEEGLDEFSISGRSYYAHLRNGEIEMKEVYPEQLGLRSTSLEAIRGGDPMQNAQIIEKVLSGEDVGARRDVILINAAAGFVVAGKAPTLDKGVEMAMKVIGEGHAMMQLIKLKSMKGSL